MSSLIPNGPWPPPHWRAKDVVVQLAVVAVALIVAAIVSAALKLASYGALALVAFCLAHIALKVFQPSNRIMRDISWPSLVIWSAIVMLGAFLLENPALFGGWTLIVVFGLFLVYGLGSLIIWARAQA